MTVNFSAGATPSATRSSRTSGLTATSAVVDAASDALEHPEQAPANRVEVAAEDVAVERVDGDRRPRIAREQPGHPPDGSGLRRVRVEDVRADAVDDGGEPPRGAQVVER